jgi:hypothetical protein
MTQDESDKELGRIVREALIKGINNRGYCEIDVVMEVAGIGPIVACIRAGLADIGR